ncbi:MAG: DUF502 domain-containing protein [Candidatus Margulisbacteria bacterium]|nr:DUF502 domain-containing protein [Candidatus Margulisiibacteriota bacterium]MBU1021559.1 DUF502 domain-containing protein [Candidatus Margulisiibacteriota bacterium]MBU1728710.1 DUF502 domain-containing protein [Candidatus Margulisiibacteriota bacterium]MBU1955161.1 DUF502 domain-containing protein [Candidatus Margulisiibacteriota bacterium]
MWQRISAVFFRGLVTLLPLLVTIWILMFMFNFLDGILGPLFNMIFGRPMPGAGIIGIIVLIFLVGYFASYIIGAKLFNWGELFLSHVPIVKSIYSSVKQVNDVLFLHKGAGEFRRACLVEYPRKGIYTVGFITSDAASEIESKAKEKLINIFIANTPTPATGFLIVVPAKDVILLDMKMDEAFRYVISGGVLKPAEVEELRKNG